MTGIAFEFPLALRVGLPLVTAVLMLFAWAERRRGLKGKRIATIACLRGAALAVLVLLAARPVWVEPQELSRKRDTVVLLVDRSESMSLEDDGVVRYGAAVAFAREQLVPALEAADLGVIPFLFAESAVRADGPQIARATPDGEGTNLARAVAQGLSELEDPPLAVIALTDGAANEHADNSRAITALVENGVPFVGIGFGRQTGGQMVSLRHVLAPAIVPPEREFQISAHLEVTGEDETPAFEVVLLRDGRLLQKRSVPAGEGSRVWLESFRVSEAREGSYKYTVQLLPPATQEVRCRDSRATATVRVSEEKGLRVLYAQGALTWDFKFIHRALRADPSVQFTGLSRTSRESVFYQNVGSDSELSGGFPSELQQMSPFHVVVLSNLSAAYLSPHQQELLARFCGELGGGVLMIGGAETFDSSWQNSRLEELLPVRFALNSSVAPRYPFRLKLTEAALEHPVFQIDEAGASRAAWDTLPTFTQFAVVESAKPGAQVWAVHPQAKGAKGRRVLMAVQRFGAGLAAMIGVQNFWRWRLAKESEPRHFDRFWQQLLRYLAEGTRDEVIIRLPDQDLRPGGDVRVVLERLASPRDPGSESRSYSLKVKQEEGEGQVLEQRAELATGRPVEFTFRAEKSGTYTLTVLNAEGASQATRFVEVRESSIELEQTACDMDRLAQWASLSAGVVRKAEDCSDVGELVTGIEERAQSPERRTPRRLPAGVNAWMLSLLLALLCAEWLLRKRWGLR